VATVGWKDEGFRSTNDVSLDWKEQLNYRIVQLSQAGDAMLYYGCKCISFSCNYLPLKPQGPMQSEPITVPITTNVVSSNSAQAMCIRYNIM